MFARPAAYDYWEDATTAPSTYFPVYAPEEIEIHNADYSIYDHMVAAILGTVPPYSLIGSTFDSDSDALPFATTQGFVGILIENTTPGWVYTLFGTGWPDTQFNDPVSPETLGPWDETDSDSWPTGYGSGGFANYVPPSVIGDGTTKIIWVEQTVESRASSPIWHHEMKFRAVTEAPAVEVAVRSEVKVGDNYNITFQSEIGKRYVLFTSNTVGGTYADSTTARHILGDGNEKTFVAYAIYQGMANGHDSDEIDETLVNYFKIYSYVSIPEYSADTTKIATASNSLHGNRFASTLPLDQMQRYGSSRWRSPNYVSYKEAHDIEQEDRRRIKIVRPENIQGFAEEYTRLLNL
tara:strand:- start:961 stop:2013 length:1053 start_codon:yes stop_codon:yes gene_type:complete